MAWKLIQTPQAQAFDLPFIGDDLAKLGRIIDLYALPCSPQAEMWVYGFFQAIPTFFITLTKPELIDINIKKGHHQPRKGKRMRFRAAHIFRDAIIEVPVPRWVVFRLYEFGQRIGWYFLVADATEDFAINWMSMAYKYAGCQSALLNYLRGVNNNDFLGPSGSQNTAGLDWQNPTRSGIGWSVRTAIITSPGQYRCTWTANFRQHPLFPDAELPILTFAQVNGVNVAVGEGGTGADGHRFTSGSFMFSHDGPPNTNITIFAQWAQDTDPCQGFGYQWSIDRVDDDEIEPDP